MDTLALHSRNRKKRSKQRAEYLQNQDDILSQESPSALQDRSRKEIGLCARQLQGRFPKRRPLYATATRPISKRRPLYATATRPIPKRRRPLYAAAARPIPKRRPLYATATRPTRKEGLCTRQLTRKEEGLCTRQLQG